MRNKSLLLMVVLAIVTCLAGCKKDQMNVNDQLTQMSGEKFLSLKYASLVNASDNQMSAKQFTLNHADKTATLNIFEYGDGVPTVKETKTYNYVLGDWAEGMFGRVLTLSNGGETFNLVYVNHALKDMSGAFYNVAEPSAEIASSVADMLEVGDWAAYDPTYVMQDRWTFDTTWYETHRSGKKIIVDTITGRYKHAEKEPIGIASQKITYLHFYSDSKTFAKTAGWGAGEQINIVDTTVTILPQMQNPAKNDTIITMTILPGVPTRATTDSIDSWSLVNVKEGGFVVKAHLQSAPATDLVEYQASAVTDTTFTIDGKVYLKLNK